MKDESWETEEQQEDDYFDELEHEALYEAAADAKYEMLREDGELWE